MGAQGAAGRGGGASPPELLLVVWVEKTWAESNARVALSPDFEASPHPPAVLCNTLDWSFMEVAFKPVFVVVSRAGASELQRPVARQGLVMGKLTNHPGWGPIHG